MTTLADMSAEERAECVGMWCDYTDPILKNGTEQWIIAGRATPTRLRKGEPRVPCVLLVKPGRHHPFLCNAKLDEVAPRFDLPRAWMPDGQPPAGEWQTAKVKIIPNENAKYDREQNVITGDAVADPDHEPRSSHDIRRWIGEWEEACPR